jgi:hypothetical protein
MLNWQSLLDDHSIPFVSRGPNTARDHISVCCPWCAEDDPSEHLGISLSTPAWGCLRNVEHRGYQPTRLIAALLGCSFHHAKQVEAHYSHIDPDLFQGSLMGEPAAHNRSDVGSSPTPGTRLLRLPSEFVPINPTGMTRRFWRYLEGRGYDNIGVLVDDYSLLSCLTGRYKDRIIIPFYDTNLNLIGWTGRALGNPINAPRYLSSSEAVKRTVLNEPILTGAKLLFITEGPFDGLKVDYYGRPHGAHATALFGAGITLDQASILNKLAPRYEKLVLLLDSDAIAQSFAVSDWLLAHNVIIGRLPFGVKDPGDLSQSQIEGLIHEASNKS